MTSPLGLRLIDRGGASSGGGQPGPPAPPPQARAFGAVSATNNPATIPLDEMNSTIIGSLDTLTLNIGTTIEGGFTIILVPETFVILRISPVATPSINELAAYTVTQDVRQVNSVNFDSYVTGPNNGGISLVRIISTVAP